MGILCNRWTSSSSFPAFNHNHRHYLWTHLPTQKVSSTMYIPCPHAYSIEIAPCYRSKGSEPVIIKKMKTGKLIIAYLLIISNF